MHIVMPASRGLIQGAILQSDTCAMPDVSLDKTAAEAGGIATASSLGCRDQATVASCLRQADLQTLVKAPSNRRGNGGADGWSPMIGGDVLPRSPRAIMEAGDGAPVPIMLGSNRDEARLFTNFVYVKGKPNAAEYAAAIPRLVAGDPAPVVRAYADQSAKSVGDAGAAVFTDAQFACPVLSFAKLAGKSSTVYAYEFDDPDAPHLFPHFFWTGPLGSYHGAEIAYVLQTKGPLGEPGKFSSRQRILADRVQDFWGSFARTGTPSTRAGERWPRFIGGDPLLLSPTKTGLASGFAARHRCAFWNARGY